jgi:hypothetical protein
VAVNKEAIETIRELIRDKDEINLEWLKTVTQMSIKDLSQVIIKHLGMVVLEGTVYSKQKAERKLKQMQEDAQAAADREAFRKGPVTIDPMTLREKLWTLMLKEKILGQDRHQFCPIWQFLENDEQSQIILRYDWIERLEKFIKGNKINKTKLVEAETIINEMGEEFKGRAKVIFAKTLPRDSFYNKNKPMWVMFLVNTVEAGIKVEGLSMINILTLSGRFRSRERTYAALNEFLELINLLVNEPEIFDEIILIQ